MYCDGHHRERHVPTHSCPTRRSSDLIGFGIAEEVAFLAVESHVDRITGLGQGFLELPVEIGIVFDNENTHCRPPLRLCRSEEHTSELQSLMRISYAVFCLKQKTQYTIINSHSDQPRRISYEHY